MLRDLPEVRAYPLPATVASAQARDSEAVAIGREIEKRHREKIEAVRHEVAIATGKRRQGSDVSIKHLAQGKTHEAVQRAVGMSRNKFEMARAVVAAAETEPEKFGDLPERMDETGNVSGTHRELQRRKAEPEEKKPRHVAIKRTRYPRPNSPT